MKRSNYKRLGDYIKKVNVRNKDSKISNLQGISMQKKFRKSTSNIVGTDLSKYKIVKKGQFCCDFMSVIRVHKFPVVLNNLEEDVIISPAYIVFEVTHPTILLPEYLMMWFSRPEFDRYADFRCDSSIRGGFQWEELCDVELPIPSHEKQQKIVADYQAVEQKIKTNEAICQKLEEAVQTIYRRWFEEFEFPDKNGKPYKSNGGKMVWNDELEKEVPEGWKVKRFTEALKLTGGGTPRTTIPEYWNGEIPFFTPADISGRFYSTYTIKNITDLGLKKSSTKLYPKNSIFITARGTVGEVTLAGCSMAMNQSCYAIKDENPFYSHQLTLNIIDELKSQAVGAVFKALVTRDFDQQYVTDPGIKAKDEFEDIVSLKYQLILKLINQNQKLEQLQSLLLARMTREEKNETIRLCHK